MNGNEAITAHKR